MPYHGGDPACQQVPRKYRTAHGLGHVQPGGTKQMADLPVYQLVSIRKRSLKGRCCSNTVCSAEKIGGWDTVTQSFQNGFFFTAKCLTLAIGIKVTWFAHRIYPICGWNIYLEKALAVL